MSYQGQTNSTDEFNRMIHQLQVKTILSEGQYLRSVYVL